MPPLDPLLADAYHEWTESQTNGSYACFHCGICDPNRLAVLCPVRVTALLRAARVSGVVSWSDEVRAWRRAIPNRSLAHAALALAEEAGEVCRAVLKEEEGIRAETRGNLADEFVDVLITAMGVAHEAGIDVGEALRSRWGVVSKKTFAPEDEGITYGIGGQCAGCGESIVSLDEGPFVSGSGSTTCTRGDQRGRPHRQRV